MKKILLVIVGLFIANSCFAIDFKNVYNAASGVTGIATSKYKEVQENKQATQNTKQQKAEQEFQKDLLSPEWRLSLHYRLISDDKIQYENDKSAEGTVYALIVQADRMNPKTTLEYKYIAKIKSLYNEIANTDNDNIPTSEQFEKKKIFISDNDFDNINDNLKSIIFMLNCY